MGVGVRRRSWPLRPLDAKRATTKAPAFVTHLLDSLFYHRHMTCSPEPDIVWIMTLLG